MRGSAKRSNTPAMATFTAEDMSGAASRTASLFANASHLALQYAPTFPATAPAASSCSRHRLSSHRSPGFGRAFEASIVASKSAASGVGSSRRDTYLSSFQRPDNTSPVPFRRFFSFDELEAETDEDSPASEPENAEVSSGSRPEARGGETTRRRDRDPTRVATRAFAPRAIDVTEWARDARYPLPRGADEVETRAIAGGVIAPRAAIIVSSDVADPKVPLRVYPARG